ncbi:hypothetical protein COV15_01910 [Candidatus Woesearchaeota archaeon CG10_big_fil_rev_8_21_14_0_10_34_12]|nr:MAG: hypothetical protein COV15_01910 [Candidatus Woesearchaeota archaeon CG10_big_fil_rev_8_21_14_0_10_34_12]
MADAEKGGYDSGNLMPNVKKDNLPSEVCWGLVQTEGKPWPCDGCKKYGDCHIDGKKPGRLAD